MALADENGKNTCTHCNAVCADATACGARRVEAALAGRPAYVGSFTQLLQYPAVQEAMRDGFIGVDSSFRRKL